MVNIRSLSGLYSGTKSLFKIGEAKLPTFIKAPERALNVELFKIDKGGVHFKDMYVFRDADGSIVRKYIVKTKNTFRTIDYDKTTLFDVDRFDYGRNGMDMLANGDKSRSVNTTIERFKTSQNVSETIKVPFDYERGVFLHNNPENHTFIRDIARERTVTSSVSDIGSGANPVVSQTTFKQSLNNNMITETSEFAEYSKGKAPRWFKASREYTAPKGTYKRDINDFDGVKDELVIKPNSQSITASSGIPTKTDDPYLFLRLHTNKKQFCSEAEPIVARKIGFRDINVDPAYYESIDPKNHKLIVEELKAYGKTPTVNFSPRTDVNAWVSYEDFVLPFFAGRGDTRKYIQMADSLHNPLNRHTERIFTLAHESQHILDGRRLMRAKMPIGNNIHLDEKGWLVWEEAGIPMQNSISPNAIGALGGWIKPAKAEYAEVQKLRDAITTYGKDCMTAVGHDNNFLEVVADREAHKILADYNATFDIHKHFPNITRWQLG